MYFFTTGVATIPAPTALLVLSLVVLILQMLLTRQNIYLGKTFSLSLALFSLSEIQIIQKYIPIQPH